MADIGDNNIVHLQEAQTNDAFPRDSSVNYIKPARCIHRVPLHLRGGSNNQHVYNPVVLSLGPYHHGKPQFRQMEEIKDEVLNRFVLDSIDKGVTNDREFFHKKTLENINSIRNNYEHEGVDEYNDEKLAKIILKDACFLMTCLKDSSGIFDMVCDRLGMSTAAFIDQDIYKLENQIPLWVIKHLFDLQDALVCRQLSFACFGNSHQLRELPWKGNEDRLPLHLLDAIRTILSKQGVTGEATMETEPHFLTKIFKCKKTQKTCNKKRQSVFKLFDLPFRSVTYLQAKGVYFRPSSYYYKDIIFTPYSCHGTLQLPIGFVNANTKSFLSNLIAFEMSPGNSRCFIISSYVNFMKSLIESSKDVKELRERGILLSTLNDEEVLRVFKEIHTYGIDDHNSFADEKRQIDQHCNNTAKTWIAELRHNYFRSPWTVVALFAATFILCLTFLQTFFTIHPAKR